MSARNPIVAGELAGDRLMRSLDYRLSPGVPPVSREQVAVVLHALADHTAIQAALVHRIDDDFGSVATSVGRWFHDVADQIEGTFIARPLVVPAVAGPVEGEESR